MAKYRCTVCNYVYDEQTGVKFQDLPGDWKCPVCGASKSAFVLLTDMIEKHNGQTTVSDVLIHQLEEWGVKCFFGIPGTSTLGIHDAIRKREHLKYIQVRHEQVAAFMASAYGKLTGGVAACVGVSGPGATNLATGLYDASLDHAPVIAITGLVARQLTGPGSIQEIDQYSFFEPICVFNKVLMSEDQTTSLGTLAVKHAILERGVSHIGVPNDVQKLPYESEVKPFKGRVPNMAFCQSVKLVKEAAELIDAARRPVIVAGFGVMGQAVELLQFANKISAPIVTTYRAKGLVNGSEPLYVGCHGGIGTTAAAKLVQTADLLLVVGSSYSDMTNIPEKRTVQIDIDPMMIAKKYPVEVGLVGNCSELVPMLRDLVSENVKDDYLREIKDLKEQWLKVLEGERDPNSTPIRPQYIMEVLSEEVADDAVLSIDVGENAWWFGRNFQMKSTQKMILSGYLASMGFGLPGAMAATVAYPDRQAVCITGDGGFAMVMGDFMTCVKYRMPVKIFVLNNSQLGMIMQEQKVEEYKNWQTELHNVDFAEYARSCGGVGLIVTEPNKLREVVKKALTSEGPVIVDILTDPKRF